MIQQIGAKIPTVVRALTGLAALAGLVFAHSAHAQYAAANPATGTSVPAGFVTCAQDYKTCTVPAGKTVTVYYGAGSSYAVLSGTGNFTCTPEGLKVSDPAPKTAKTCWVKGADWAPVGALSATPLASAAAPANPLVCAEGKSCAATVAWTGVYGAPGKFVPIAGPGQFTCALATFSINDPAPGVAKSCHVVPVAGGAKPAPTAQPAQPAPPTPSPQPAPAASGKLADAPPSGAVACATDGKRCDASGAWTGVYGVAKKYAPISGNGPFTCLPKGYVKTPSAATPADTGVDDPAPGVGKTCYIVGKIAAQAPAPAPTPATASSGECQSAWDASGIKPGANCLYRNQSGRDFGSTCPSESKCSCQCAANKSKTCTFQGKLIREPVCRPGS